MHPCRVSCRVICREIRATRHDTDMWNQWLKPQLSGLSGFYSRREPGRNRISFNLTFNRRRNLSNLFYLLDLLDAFERR